MTGTRSVSIITAVVVRSQAERLQTSLGEAGVSALLVAAGRSSLLEETSGFAKVFIGNHRLFSEPVSILSFFVPTAQKDAALHFVKAKAGLHVPGQGSVFAETFQLANAHPRAGIAVTPAFDAKTTGRVHTDLVGVSCVVQRGAGDDIARCVLELGAGVPTVTFANGMGLRDKLGLLRITIPAEKDVVQVVIHEHDLAAVLDTVITVGRLDQPGKGFVSAFSVDGGIVNAKLTRGALGQAASIEQVIAALDHMSGNTEWRQANIAERGGSSRRFFGGMDLRLVCDETIAAEVIRAAMDAGAPGATISKLHLAQAVKDTSDKGTAARVLCRMVVPEGAVDAITAAMTAAGAFSDEGYGIAMTRTIAKAFTYTSHKAA